MISDVCYSMHSIVKNFGDHRCVSECLSDDFAKKSETV